MDHDLGRAPFRALLLDVPQDMDGGALGAAYMARAAAMRAGDEACLGETGPQTLTAHFQDAEMADVADLDACAVVLQRLL